MPKQHISVVLPAFNEQDNIQPVYDTLKKVFEPFESRYDWSLLFVDDGSKDQTPVRLIELQQKHPEHVRYLIFSRNFGKERAVLAGLDNADADAVIIMDADLQHPPEKIPEMIRYYEEGYDDVFGLKTDRGKESFLKKTVTAFFYKVMSRDTGNMLIPNVGDFRLLSRRAVEAFCRYRECNRYNKGYFALIGFKKIAIPYEVAERQSGTTKWSTWKLIKFAMDGLTGFSMSILRVSTILGAVIAFISFLGGLTEIIIKLVNGSTPGYPTLIAAITFLGGLQLLFIGILGEYIGRIYREEQGRPLYIVQDSALKKISSEEIGK